MEKYTGTVPAKLELSIGYDNANLSKVAEILRCLADHLDAAGGRFVCAGGPLDDAAGVAVGTWSWENR